MIIPDIWITQAFHAAVRAGEAILEVYRMTDFEVSMKADKSPITLADRRADIIIKEHLRHTGISLLSEESSDIPFPVRKKWKTYWLVDPLDGTKEFIHRNDEFTVNIALIEIDTPVFGIIYIPVYRQLYFAILNRGAYRLNNVRPGEISGIQNPGHCIAAAARLPDEPSHKNIRISVSRSHLSPETKQYLKNTYHTTGKIELISSGSSLKFCRIAEGKTDLYPRLGPTMEWDIAAGHILVTEAGGTVKQPDGGPVIYNKENLLNPWFVAKSANYNMQG